MATTEAFVDLGEDFDPPADPPSVPWPRSVRRLRLPVLLGLILLLCGASLSAPPSPLRLVVRAPVTTDVTAMIEGPTLYVLDLMNGVRAFNLADGRPLWSAHTIELATETTLTYADRKVIVSMSDTDATGEHTVALDAATGRRVWTSDYGSARMVAGGVLVTAMPRPPGFNYPGTPQSGAVRLIDPSTGAVRWTYDIDVNCSYDVTSAIVELCPNDSQLKVISLADGKLTARRSVQLGDAATNFLLPLQDQLDVPQLQVAGDTVLISHASMPKPVLDAYAMSDLHRVWGGIPIVEGQAFQQCGTAVCLTDGPSAGDAYDLRTGHPVTSSGFTFEPVPTEPYLVLLPMGLSSPDLDPSPLPSAAAGAGVSLPEATPVVPTFLLRQSGGGPAPIGVLPGADLQSCAQIAGYVVCTTDNHALTVWKVR